MLTSVGIGEPRTLPLCGGPQSGIPDLNPIQVPSRPSVGTRILGPPGAERNGLQMCAALPDQPVDVCPVLLCFHSPLPENRGRPCGNLDLIHELPRTAAFRCTRSMLIVASETIRDVPGLPNVVCPGSSATENVTGGWHDGKTRKGASRRSPPVLSPLDSASTGSASLRATTSSSERGDLNPGPPEPHSGALPGCATLR